MLVQLSPVSVTSLGNGIHVTVTGLAHSIGTKTGNTDIIIQTGLSHFIVAHITVECTSVFQNTLSYIYEVHCVHVPARVFVLISMFGNNLVFQHFEKHAGYLFVFVFVLRYFEGTVHVK